MISSDSCSQKGVLMYIGFKLKWRPLPWHAPPIYLRWACSLETLFAHFPRLTNLNLGLHTLTLDYKTQDIDPLYHPATANFSLHGTNTPSPPVTATRTQSPYPPSYRNRSSATHFNVTLDNTPLRFPHRISAGLTRVQDICYLAIPAFRPPLAIHKLLYINFDTEPHPLSCTTCQLQEILQALFYSWKSLILRYTAPVNTTPASSFMLNMRHSMPQSPHLRTMAYALSFLLLQMTSKCHFSSIAFHSKWPVK